jgi:hypothetical protein
MLVDPVRGPDPRRRARALRGDDLLYGITLRYRGAALYPEHVWEIDAGAGFRLCLSLPCTNSRGVVE